MAEPVAEEHLILPVIYSMSVSLDDFGPVSTVGLESSPAAAAGLRANEARYFKNKYDHVFTVEPAGDAQSTVDWVHRILKEERGIVISARSLEATAFQVENMRMAYVFYEDVLLSLDSWKSLVTGPVRDRPVAGCAVAGGGPRRAGSS